MNKDFIKRLTVVAVILTLATASLVAGTFAKYTTEIEGTATARVAKFDVSAVLASDGEGAATFGLFDTILDTSGSLEENVKPGGANENIIAPGTQGSFGIELENNSEVTVQYAIAFTGDLKSVPLEFSIDGGTNWKTTLSDLDISAGTDTEIAISGADVTKTVQWQWLFEKASETGRDTADTLLGKAGTATPTVTATVTFTQVD